MQMSEVIWTILCLTQYLHREIGVLIMERHNQNQQINVLRGVHTGKWQLMLE